MAEPAKTEITKGPSASKKKAPKKKGVNKSQEIRDLASAMKNKGEKPRPVVIIDQLKKRGIEVSSPQVSMVLKKMGFRPRTRRGPSVAAQARAASTPSATKNKISVTDLVKAQKIAKEMGGIERAIASLEALRHFE